MTSSRWMFILIVFSAFFAKAAISQAPLCDGPLCTPNPGSGSYAGAAVARAKMLNARGYSSSIVAKAPLAAATANGANDVTVIGSQSYNYTIPILALPGRAGMDLVLNLYYNSRIWDVDSTDNTVSFNADRDFPSYGFRLDFGFIEIVSGQAILTEHDGTKRVLLSPNGAGYYQVTDGSNIVFGLTGSGVLAYSNGLQVQYQQFPSNTNLWRPVWVKDTNGNYFSIAYVSGHDQLISQVSDTLGRVITFNYDSSNRLISLTQAVHPSGTKTYVNFQWGTATLNYAFASPLTVTNSLASGSTINVLTGCTYPTGNGYRFIYGDWGIINEIDTLSSLGANRTYVQYNYPLASAGALNDAPSYSQQTISPDGTTGNASAWNYATTKNGTGVVTSMAITDPNGTTATTNLDPTTGLTSSLVIKDNTNTTLRTISYTWTTGSLSGATLPATIATTNDSGQQSSIQYAYDLNDETSDVYEYDFGGVLKRHTVTTYLNSSNTTHHILNLPTRITILDGSGNTIARKDISYDGNALTSVTGVNSHDDSAYGASFTIRGNISSVNRYSNASAGTGAFTRNFYYDSLGNLLTAQLDCCNQKIFNFSSTTQSSFPDSVVRGPSGGPQFTTSYTYDPDSSLLLSSTEENGQITQYQYDSMGRQTQMTLPPQNGTAVQVNTAYNDAAVSPAVTQSNTANNSVTVTTFDGLGHVLRVDGKNCPVGQPSCSTVVSSVSYAYDKLWQRVQESNPYAPTDTIVNTTFSYDALGRTTKVTPPSAGYTQYQYSGNSVTITDPAGKQRKNFTDALGRLTEVDEPGETYAGTVSTGVLTINGTLQGQTGSGSPASGSVTISGTEQSAEIDPCQDQEPPRSCPRTIWDSGTVSVTVNGFTKSATYGMASDPTSIASALSSAFNGDSSSPVTASASGTVLTLIAKTAGTVGNSYGLSASACTNDSNDFGGGPSCPGNPSAGSISFQTSTSGATLSGGIPGTTSYDSGTVTVSVGSSFTASAPYSQSGNGTAALVASALVSTGSTGLNRAGSTVHAVANGASISLTFNTVGVAGNVNVSAASSSNDPVHFPSGSFSGSTSLTGGTDSYSTGLGHPYATTYTYDVLDNLTGSTQAAGNVNGQPVSGQVRTYVYDSLGRLTSSTTPESGALTAYYTTSGGNACAGDPTLPCRVQDARGTIKTLAYDAINRTTSVTYSDSTPSVSYQYDSGGSAAFALNRLTKIIEGPNSQTLTYDNLGRVTAVSQMIDTTTYVTQYSYNLASQMTSVVYPTGRAVATNVDPVGRLSTVADSSGTYLNNLSYNAAGEALGFTLGNGVQGTFLYNDHLQISSLRYSKSGASSDVLNLSYDYTSGVSGNNGQIQTIHYYTSPGVEDTTKSEKFTYDPWARLSAAQTLQVNSTAGTWSLQWTYDRLGNRLSQTLVGGNVTIGQPSFQVDPTTNRIIGYCYDAVGNLLDTGTCPGSGHQYTYDGSNRLTQINGGPSYTYFGQLRIKKISGTTTTVYIYSGSKPIVEYVNGTLSKEYIYAGSKLLATIAGNSTTYHHPDHLSNRAETDASGNPTRTYGHFPFGETWYETGTADKWKFTSYERDSGTGETGLDYAQFRHNSPALGRFMSADLLGGNLNAPQSRNRYSYALNDPVNAADPLGLFIVCLGNFHSDDGGQTWTLTAVIACWDTDFGMGGNAETGNNTGGGGGGVDILKNSAKDLSKKNLDKQKCLDDLKKLGLTPDDIKAGAQAANFLNGVGSTVPLADLYPPAAANSVTGTVGDKIAEPGTRAVASLVGHDIYVNSDAIKAGDYYNNLGTAFHEIIHNLTGLGDTDIQMALGLKTTEKSSNITQKLIKDCL